MVTTMNGSSGGGGDESDSSSIQQQQTITISSVTSNNNALVVEHSLDDDDDDGMSDDSGPDFANSADLMHATMEDEVTAQLAAAGPVGMAAAAAIASAKKRKRPHQFETNPSIRKRQQTRLLRKLRQTIDEFTIRVGMQAVVLVAIPGKPQNSFKCFGAKPLEDVIRNLRPVVMQDLESALAQHAPAPAPEDPSLHELPPLVIDGIPTPVEKMTQAQLRAFIPLMLKYSTGRGKPGWGKESTRPPWWPQDLPWANVRMDARTEDEKQKVSWTHALRQIVINCYKYHGREDLLPVFNADNEEASNNNNTSSNVHNNSSNTNNTASSNNMVDIKPPPAKIPKSSPQNQIQQIQTVTAQAIPQYGVVGAHGFQPTVLQTISNPDGTVSIIQVDPTNSIITLPDGTTAQVQGLATLQQGGGGDGHHHHHPDDSHHHHTTHHQLIQQQDLAGMTVDLNSVAQATLGQEGQIILTGEDGHAYPVTVSGMITVPVNASMYQTVVANISSVQQPDGSMQTKFILPSTTTTHIQQPKQRLSARQTVSRVVTPMVLPKVEPGTEHETTTIPVSALTGDPSQTQLVTVNANGQVVHDNKIYQICEFQRAENQEKVIMMAEVTPSASHHHQQQSQGQEDQQQVQSKDTSNSSSGSPSSVPSDQQQQSIGVSEQQQQQQQQQTS